MQNKTYLVVGLGNMGSAIVSGLLDAGVPAQNITAVVHGEGSKEKAKVLGLSTVRDVVDVKYADVVLLSIKPQVAEGVLLSLKHLVAGGSVFVSVMAGVTVAKLQDLLGGGAQVVRCMPNLPAQIKQAVSVLYADDSIDAGILSLVRGIFESIGCAYVLDDEEKMHAVTAISGSGPAFIYAFMEAFLSFSTSNGLSETVAKDMIIKTFLGAVNLSDNSKTLEELRVSVTSKGGTTEAGLSVYVEKNVNMMIIEMLEKARKRSSFLS